MKYEYETWRNDDHKEKQDEGNMSTEHWCNEDHKERQDEGNISIEHVAMTVTRKNRMKEI
jgi:hypothetical protein